VYDGWEFNEQLREIERVLHVTSPGDESMEELYKREFPRFELPHLGPNPWHIAGQAVQKSQKSPMVKRPVVLSSAIWLSLSLGTASFVCGAILLVWAFSSGHSSLWTVGLPAVIVGQVGILVGVVLQLDRLWRENRAATAKLNTVDEQLHELKDAKRLPTTRSNKSPCDSPLFDDIGASAMMDNLKGQIDLLAMKIGQGKL
jgi:hypothetical protein